VYHDLEVMVLPGLNFSLVLFGFLGSHLPAYPPRNLPATRLPGPASYLPAYRLPPTWYRSPIHTAAGRAESADGFFASPFSTMKFTPGTSSQGFDDEAQRLPSVADNFNLDEREQSGLMVFWGSFFSAVCSA
jgi:hypothetical protein